MWGLSFNTNVNADQILKLILLEFDFPIARVTNPKTWKPCIGF